MKPALSAAALIAITATACKKEEEIKVYRVARAAPVAEQAADPHAGMNMPGGADAADPHAGIPGMDPHAGIPGMGAGGGDPHAGITPQQMAMMGTPGGPEVSDEPPAGWTKLPPTTMRQLSYKVTGADDTGADVSLVILRGAAGAKLENVNRWRAQFDQPALDADSLGGQSEAFTTSVGEALLVDIEGLAPDADGKMDGRMLGAIIDSGRDGWFFRMRGNAQLTGTQKDAFVSWVKSVKPAEKPAGAPAGTPADEAEPPCCPTDAKPGDHADHAPKPTTATAPAGDGRLEWQAPAGWVLDPAASSMRFATFRIAGPGNAKGEMAVTHFPGDVGGDLQNVNRWLGQVGLPAVDQAGLDKLVTHITAGPKQMAFVDLKGDKTRMATGWTRHGPDTWFFKLSGPDALVEGEMAKFTAFLESVRFTTPE